MSNKPTKSQKILVLKVISVCIASKDEGADLLKLIQEHDEKKNAALRRALKVLEGEEDFRVFEVIREALLC